MSDATSDDVSSDNELKKKKSRKARHSSSKSLSKSSSKSSSLSKSKREISRRKDRKKEKHYRKRRRETSSSSSDSSTSGDSCESSLSDRGKRHVRRSHSGKERSSLKKKKRPCSKTDGKAPEVVADRRTSFEDICDVKSASRLIKSIRQLDIDATHLLILCFTKLDDGEGVCVDDISNQQMRKKLRHLFRSLRVELKEIDGESMYVKSEDIKSISLSSKVTDILANHITSETHQSRVGHKKIIGPMRPQKIDSDSDDEFGPRPSINSVGGKLPVPASTSGSRESWMCDVPKSMTSFFDAAQQNDEPLDIRSTAEYKKEQKTMKALDETLRAGRVSLAEEYNALRKKPSLQQEIQKKMGVPMETSLPWGVPINEQTYSNRRSATNQQDDKEPWVRFNRERDVLSDDSKLPISKCEDFLNRAKSQSNQFDSSGYLSSFY